MFELTWEKFKEFNGSGVTSRFEELCRHWFDTAKVEESEHSHANSNQPGVELEAVKIKSGQMASFQAKFSDGRRPAYADFEKSFKKIPPEERKTLDIVFMCSNRTINTGSKTYERIRDDLKADGITVIPFSNKDIISWAEDKPEIVRLYWGSDIAEVKKNTELGNKKLDDIYERVNNTGIDIADLNNYVYDFLPTKSDMERLLAGNDLNVEERKSDDVEERLQYLIPKDTLANIDQTLLFFNKLITDQDGIKVEHSSEFDGFIFCFLQVLFCGSILLDNQQVGIHLINTY